MGGEAQCVPETCEVTSCPSGEKLQLLNPYDCCPQCVVDETSCKDSAGLPHNVSNVNQVSFTENLPRLY